MRRLARPCPAVASGSLADCAVVAASRVAPPTPDRLAKFTVAETAERAEIVKAAGTGPE